MERPHPYTYPYQSPGHGRYAASQGTSSAFSASANPNEDWTKISDLAERRRIQNRIAQRNYRKKLKRRLEDLERRAASTSASPEQAYQELARPDERAASSKAAPPSQRPGTITAPRRQRQSPEPMSHPGRPSQDDRPTPLAQHVARDLSASPPPLFTFATYPPAEPVYYPDYSHAASAAVPAPYYDHAYHHQYHASLHSTLPLMPSATDGIKQESLFADDDLLSPFNINYASISGADVYASRAYSDASAHTPSLTDSHSFDHSRENSPLHSHLAFPPSPPASLSGSPYLSSCSVR